jgi:hypothetical protein
VLGIQHVSGVVIVIVVVILVIVVLVISVATAVAADLNDTGTSHVLDGVFVHEGALLVVVIVIVVC